MQCSFEICIYSHYATKIVVYIGETKLGVCENNGEVEGGGTFEGGWDS